MADLAIPFHDLAERIQQREAELAKLRQEFESRQTHLSELTQRKEAIQTELRKLDQEIQAVGQNGIPDRTAASPAATSKAAPSKALGKPANRVSLPKYLVHLVRQAKRPITAKELTQELVRNQFPTTARNLEGMVKTRVYDLVRKGILGRADDSTGFVVAKAGAKPVDVKARMGIPKSGKKTSAKSATSTAPAKWRSLHEVLTHVLSKSSRPLSARELADQVTESGYASKSKDLKNVIWVSVGKLAGVERIPGEGYRLKKGKSSGNKS